MATLVQQTLKYFFVITVNTKGFMKSYKKISEYVQKYTYKYFDFILFRIYFDNIFFSHVIYNIFFSHVIKAVLTHPEANLI